MWVTTTHVTTHQPHPCPAQEEARSCRASLAELEQKVEEYRRVSADGQVSAVVMKERMERAEKDLEELVQVRLGRGKRAGVPTMECALTEVVMNLCTW